MIQILCLEVAKRRSGRTPSRAAGAKKAAEVLVVLTWPIMTSDDGDEWIMDTKMLTGADAADDGREGADAAGGRGSGNGGGRGRCRERAGQNRGTGRGGGKCKRQWQIKQGRG